MSNISVVAVFKLTIGLWVDNMFFMQDYNGEGYVPDRIEIHNDAGEAVVKVIDENDQVIYTKPTHYSFDKIVTYAEALHELPIFTKLDEPEPSHRACVETTDQVITLRALSRT